ncbi:MAG: peptide chain release factor 3 [Cyanobacteriota bacterium]|nr:peptide chain release factor 3 [Cyanobacteriota bacterium]
MTQSELAAELSKEIERRRTFAIISHPDAGKTTLTEKLLLYGGAVNMAGAVKAKRHQRHATSDWMKLEQQRGISITSTVLQFDYNQRQINLLDTPGHQDFSEDTYRTLAAADNAVMLLDGAKGLETQTLKLFEICKLRHLPIFSFINKMDRPTREPLELLDEIERVLGLTPYAVNWPIGTGDRFQGVYDRQTQEIHVFERQAHGQKAAKLQIAHLGDPILLEWLEPELYYQLKEELEILQEVSPQLDRQAVHAGVMTPVFFGSAMTNFGVQLFLDNFLEMALAPGAHLSSNGSVDPDEPDFSGFVFKLQANMDPRHRDRIAFVRVCSGKFEKDMTVHHVRTGKEVRLSRAHKLFAQDREVIETAYAGDIVGLINPGLFSIGDTICTGKPLQFEGIPSFSPEHFAWIRNPNPSKFKPFMKGIEQLKEEGAVQILYSLDEAKRDPILAAVGPLQFEVVQFRLENEYNVETRLEPLAYTIARWIEGGWEVAEHLGSLYNSEIFKDSWSRPVLLCKNIWSLQQIQERLPKLKLLTIAPVQSITAS